MSKQLGGTIKPREDARLPKPVVDIVVDDGALIEFFEEIQKTRSVKHKALVSLFRARAALSPQYRLAANLKNLLGCIAQSGGSVINVLDNGISQQEKQALFDLEDGEVSTQALATAHGLLNIRERQELLPVLTETFRNQPSRGFIEFED